MSARAAKAAQTGKKPRRLVPPERPVEGPLPTDQVNLTDEHSLIMPVARRAFEQCYNAQTGRGSDSLLVVAAHAAQAPNYKQQLEPMLRKIDSTLACRTSQRRRSVSSPTTAISAKAT